MFAELFIVSEEQCVAIPESTPLRVAACAEPLGVTLHAVARAGAMLGRKLLVTGSGPIGALVAASARLAGAAEIVVTDLFDEALAIASRMGATEVVNVRTNEARLAAFMQGGGYFDAAFEASGNVRTCGRWKTVLGLPGPEVESCRSASCQLGSRHCP
jgi:L-idonate 5-dehydrogenase